MTLKVTETLKGFFKALLEPPFGQASAPAGSTPRADADDGKSRSTKPDESLFWGWSMYGHW